MLNVAAHEYHLNQVYMKVTRQKLRDALDPFDMPDERLLSLFIAVEHLPKLNLNFLYFYHNLLVTDLEKCIVCLDVLLPTF